ncbi:hypothetical protein LTR53_018819, partial [Teratosphaeriaceae sp. CCFEE 6253]
ATPPAVQVDTAALLEVAAALLVLDELVVAEIDAEEVTTLLLLLVAGAVADEFDDWADTVDVCTGSVVVRVVFGVEVLELCSEEEDLTEDEEADDEETVEVDFADEEDVDDVRIVIVVVTFSPDETLEAEVEVEHGLSTRIVCVWPSMVVVTVIFPLSLV